MMMKKTLLLAALVAGLLLSACAAPAEPLELDLGQIEAAQATIVRESRSLEMGGAVYSEIDISRQLYFYDQEQPEQAMLDMINADIDAVIDDFISRFQQEEEPLFAADSSLLFEHWVSFVGNGIGPDTISIIINTETRSQKAAQAVPGCYGLVYDAHSGQRLHLADFLGPDYQQMVVEQIYQRIEENDSLDDYYGNLEQLLLQYLDPIYGWYTPSGEYAQIIYQPYTIAPGSRGVLHTPVNLPNSSIV